MVHVLEAIHRTLKPNGYLIDLRPFSEMPPVDIVVDEQVLSAGFIDGTSSREKYQRADAALEAVVSSGLFTREDSDTFDLDTYWDDVLELVNYMTERTSSILPTDMLERAEQLLSAHRPHARLRTRLSMKIARYRKLS